MERPVRIGRKTALQPPGRSLGVIIHYLPVIPHHILDIRGILEPAFDLERTDAGSHQVGEALVEPQVAGREERAVADDDAAGCVDQVVAGAAGLGADTAVRAATRELLAQVALPAVAHAQRAVDEELQFAVDGRADGPDLFERQLPLQHQARKAQGFQFPRPFGRPDGRLRGGVQLHGRQRHLKQAQILDDEHIDAGLIQLLHQRLRLRTLLVREERVDGGVDFGAIAVGIAAKAVDVFDRIAGRRTGAEGWPGDINGIGTAVDRCDADIRISRRSEQFKSGYLHLFCSI